MYLEGSHSGLVRPLGERIYRKVSRVQISPPPLDIMKNILLIPGWGMRKVELYNNDNLFEIRRGKLDKNSFSADYVIGLSLGALVALQNARNIRGKIILINPPIPKRSVVVWFFHWLDYLINEGLFLERQKFIKNPIRWGLEIINCLKLLSTDFSKVFDNFPKEKFTVIRGKNDRFFCDEKAVKFLIDKNINFIEVEGGHNWSEAIEKAIENERQT